MITLVFSFQTFYFATSRSRELSVNESGLLHNPLSFYTLLMFHYIRLSYVKLFVRDHFFSQCMPCDLLRRVLKGIFLC